MGKKWLMILSAIAAVSVNAEVLWHADFSKDLGGFQVIRKGLNDSAKVENGELILTFNPGKYKGMHLRQEIPYPEKGEISFDAAVNIGKSRKYYGFSLQFLPFGCSFSFNGINSALMRLADNQWTTLIKKIPYAEKKNYRFAFDRTKKTMDVYYDGAMIPTFSFKDVKFAAPVNGKGVIAFGNYGFPEDTIINSVSNLKLTASEAVQSTESRVVWTEKFEKNGSMEDNGFTKVRDNKKDSFTVNDGVLKAVCQNSPYRGSSFNKKMPGLLRGELSFEANVGNGNGYNHYTITVAMGNLSMSFRANSALHVFHTKQQKWATVTGRKMTRGAWHKILVRFDAVRHVTEYYIDDMENPVFIDENCNYDPKREQFFTITNYGLCSGTIENYFRNFELKEIPEAKNEKSTDLSGTLIYRGFSDGHWNYKEFSKKLGESNVAEFVVTPVGAHTNNKNNPFEMQPKPSPNRGLAKYIILADMPATPIPPYAFKHIIESVENGGKLIVLGGLFTLQKGEYAGTELEKILPVSVKDRWKEVAALPGAKVEKIDGKYDVISKSFGKGMVYVVPGNVIKDPAIANVLMNYQF